MTDVRTIVAERRIRELLSEIAANGGQRTSEQQEEYLRLSTEMLGQEQAPDAPTPMLPILQLYLRDARGVVAGPEGADLLQVLWCPFDHGTEMMPRTNITWRRAADVRAVLHDAPVPALIQRGHYLPNVCVLHPEPVTEYPPRLLLPAEINDRLTSWMASAENRFPVVYDEERMAVYQYALSVAPGCKMGGWAPVSFCDVDRVDCRSCGTAMTPFFYIDSSEWDAGTYPWRPLEEVSGPVDPHNIPPGPGDDEVGILIGRGYGMQIYICPADRSHPHVEIMQ
ncbi:MAG TPA: hypothetical protein VL551_18595 [Actinospica sp.]|jgi:hypothetical protein|nr:hypothetical protein [Actinospica sp.]